MLIFVQNLSNFTCLTTEFHNYDHTKGELTKGDLFYFGMAGGSGHNTILKTISDTVFICYKSVLQRELPAVPKVTNIRA